jgi:hypothetical protein
MRDIENAKSMPKKAFSILYTLMRLGAYLFILLLFALGAFFIFTAFSPRQARELSC